MSTVPLQTLAHNLELLFSAVAPAPRVLPSSRLIEHRVSAHSFSLLLAQWANMPTSSRPRLRGLSANRDAKRELILLLDLGARSPLMSLFVEGGPFPTLRFVWPYATWWENELRSFEGVSFPASGDDLGVDWQHA